MKMRSIDGRRLSIRRSALALAAIVMVLGAALLAEAAVLFDDSWSEPMTAASRRALDLPELSSSAAWPDASKIAADGRTLFAPKIAAVPVAPPEPAPPEQPKEQLSLIAIVIGPGGRFALLRAEQSQAVQQVQEGGSVGGWNLAAVEDNRVILEDGGQQSVLYLPDTSPENP
jgi:hypothetical protein